MHTQKYSNIMKNQMAAQYSLVNILSSIFEFYGYDISFLEDDGFVNQMRYLLSETQMVQFLSAYQEKKSVEIMHDKMLNVLNGFLAHTQKEVHIFNESSNETKSSFFFIYFIIGKTYFKMLEFAKSIAVRLSIKSIAHQQGIQQVISLFPF